MFTTTFNMSTEYLLVSNIPSSFHSADLRNFFSDYIETEKITCFHFRHRPQSEIVFLRSTQEKELDTENASEERRKFLAVSPVCCILKCKDVSEKIDIWKKYHFQHWISSNDTILPERCIIIDVKTEENLDSSTVPSVHVKPTKLEVKLSPEKLATLMELKPPVLMPRGNVGTPTKHFLKLINSCQLPSKLIGKLGLHFSKSRMRKYGMVPFDYGNTSGREAPFTNKFSRSKRKEESRRRQNTGEGEGKKEEEEEDEEEEWDRHNELHDDVTEQERNKERLYEEEMEVVWEKGGPGIVWYTDAQLWKEAEGDFDEQTTDDWDVDYSIYNEEGGGDKDARDALEMRRSEMWREGDMESVFKKPNPKPSKKRDNRILPYRKTNGKETVGPFEQHTRGIGRRLMERQGWSDGLGLGRSQKGIAKPIESEGQKPKERKGLGFFGEPLPRFGTPVVPRPFVQGVTISTVFDHPDDTDPKEPLLTRNQPTFMKFRR